MGLEGSGSSSAFYNRLFGALDEAVIAQKRLKCLPQRLLNRISSIGGAENGFCYSYSHSLSELSETSGHGPNVDQSM